METRVIAVVGCVAMNLTVITHRLPEVGEAMLARNYVQSPGGKATITAIAAYRSSHLKARDGETQDGGTRLHQSNCENIDIHVRMIGAVGDDEYATRMLEYLRSENIDVSGIEPVPGQKTGIRFSIVMVPMGSARYVIVPGATATVSKDRFVTTESLGGGVRPDLIIAQMDIQREVVEAILEHAYAAKIDVLLNASPAQIIQMKLYKYINHLLLQQAEAVTLLGIDADEISDGSFSEIASEFIESGVHNVVIGLPDGGIYYASKTGQSGHIKFPYEQKMDVTVRGGTCVGTYAAEYLRQKALGYWDIKACVIKAEMACAIAVQGNSGQGGVPWADDIQEYQSFHEPQAEDITILVTNSSNSI